MAWSGLVDFAPKWKSGSKLLEIRTTTNATLVLPSSTNWKGIYTAQRYWISTLFCMIWIYSARLNTSHNQLLQNCIASPSNEAQMVPTFTSAKTIVNEHFRHQITSQFVHVWCFNPSFPVGLQPTMVRDSQLMNRIRIVRDRCAHHESKTCWQRVGMGGWSFWRIGLGNGELKSIQMYSSAIGQYEIAIHLRWRPCFQPIVMVFSIL